MGTNPPFHAQVIAEADRLVLIDGYLRVEALRRLGRDQASAITWPVTEPEALLQHRHLASTGPTAIEDAWLLARLLKESAGETEADHNDDRRTAARLVRWPFVFIAAVAALAPGLRVETAHILSACIDSSSSRWS